MVTPDIMGQYYGDVLYHSGFMSTTGTLMAINEARQDKLDLKEVIRLGVMSKSIWREG